MHYCNGPFTSLLTWEYINSNFLMFKVYYSTVKMIDLQTL